MPSPQQTVYATGYFVPSGMENVHVPSVSIGSAVGPETPGVIFVDGTGDDAEGFGADAAGDWGAEVVCVADTGVPVVDVGLVEDVSPSDEGACVPSVERYHPPSARSAKMTTDTTILFLLLSAGAGVVCGYAIVL